MYKMLVLDIDGTLRPTGQPRVPKENADAVRAVQKYGVKVVVATGRGYAGIPRGMLRGIKPDYWLCSAGAHLLDGKGSELAADRMTAEEMYALVDFCEDHEYPLGFAFRDGNYVYVEYAALHAKELQYGVELNLTDGEDQDHHREEMPFSAFAQLPQSAGAAFVQKYPHLGLRFLYYSEDGCDVLRPGQDKSLALQTLLGVVGQSAADCVAVGDGANDVELLRSVGLSFCVQGGTAAAQLAATRICPTASACGVAAVCREVWPQAFDEKVSDDAGT